MKPMLLQFRQGQFIALTVFVAAVLGACAPIVPGSSREADVLSRYGTPTAQRALADGGKVLDFSGQPLGVENWRFTMSADGTVRSAEQLLDEAHFSRIRQGMTRDEVIGEIGLSAASETQRYPGLNEEALSWRYMEPGGRRYFFNAHFDASSGRLKHTSRTPDPVDNNVNTDSSP